MTFARKLAISCFSRNLPGPLAIAPTPTKMPMKTIALILLAGLAWSSAAVAGDMVDALPNGPLLRLFGHDQRPLPARFRNHCHRDIWGRFYCSNHCGSDYQFYYCAKDSFGCCHVGMGYCDRDGFLRCRP